MLGTRARAGQKAAAEGATTHPSRLVHQHLQRHLASLILHSRGNFNAMFLDYQGISESLILVTFYLPPVVPFFWVFNTKNIFNSGLILSRGDGIYRAVPHGGHYVSHVVLCFFVFLPFFLFFIFKKLLW